MRTLFLACLLAIFCQMTAYTQTAEQFADIWDKQHVSKIFPSDVRHADLKKYLDDLKKLGVKVEQVGMSNANREIYQMEFGHGPLKVFMWSQMHGDEPTATSALIDLFSFLQKEKDSEVVKKIADKITLRAVPMLNPDGAEAYKRRNQQDIDINRDAQNLATPEAQLLKKLRDDWNPSIGFNLHNQNELTTVGSIPSQASISFLVVYGDAAKTSNPGHERNRRIASAMVVALNKFIPGHIGRYGDEWTPSAFGDNFSAWGTPVILIETGALHGKDEMYLVKMNFIAFMTALQSLATGSEATQDNVPYGTLISNGSGGIVSVVFRRANVIKANPALPAIPNITITDIAGVAERRRASFTSPVTIRGISSNEWRTGLDEFDASGFYVVQRFGRLASGELAELFFYKKDRNVNWLSTDLEKEFPPDAVYSNGKFTKGDGLLRRIR